MANESTSRAARSDRATLNYSSATTGKGPAPRGRRVLFLFLALTLPVALIAAFAWWYAQSMRAF